MTKPLVFLVDDEAELTFLLEQTLSSKYRVKTFNAPKAFIDYFSSESELPDVLVTDYKMEGMDGVSMVSEVFKLGFSFPVILVSGYLEKSNLLRAMDLGFVKVLEKPEAFDQLDDALELVLLEHDIYIIRQRIRKMTSEARELYSFLRDLLYQYVPAEDLDRVLIQPDDSEPNSGQRLDLDKTFDNLEKEMEVLLNAERNLELRKMELKSNKASDV